MRECVCSGIHAVRACVCVFLLCLGQNSPECATVCVSYDSKTIRPIEDVTTMTRLKEYEIILYK